MFATKSAQSLKNLFAGYHEPAALNRAQSQKLLDGLKASFRSQLDKEYGPSRTPDAVIPSTSGTGHLSRPSPANQHLKDVLTNPLFGYKANSPTRSPVKTPLDFRRDPMDVFDQGVARGLMNIRAATGVILTKTSHLREAPANLRQVDVRETTLRVLAWLKSSEYYKDMRFLSDRSFMRAFMPLLLQAGEEEVAWEWLTYAINERTASTGQDQTVSDASVLLSQLARSKKQSRQGLNSADGSISSLLEAEKLFGQNPLLPSILLEPWQTVSWRMTVTSYQRQPAAAGLFDAHLNIADRLKKDLVVEKAHLHLHHPKQPDDQLALRFFYDKSKVADLVRSEAETGSPSKRPWLNVVPWILSLGEDTVNSLARSGKSDEARDVAELLASKMFNHNLQPA